MRCMGMFRLPHCLRCRQYNPLADSCFADAMHCGAGGRPGNIASSSHMDTEICNWRRYSFAAATADVWHQQVDYIANLVPGYGPIGERHR